MGWRDTIAVAAAAGEEAVAAVLRLIVAAAANPGGAVTKGGSCAIVNSNAMVRSESTCVGTSSNLIGRGLMKDTTKSG